jgi:hypothetical protein
VQTKGYNTDYFMIMHRIVGFRSTPKGVVCPFAASGVPAIS